MFKIYSHCIILNNLKVIVLTFAHITKCSCFDVFLGGLEVTKWSARAHHSVCVCCCKISSRLKPTLLAQRPWPMITTVDSEEQQSFSIYDAKNVGSSSASKCYCYRWHCADAQSCVIYFRFYFSSRFNEHILLVIFQ